MIQGDNKIRLFYNNTNKKYLHPSGFFIFYSCGQQHPQDFRPDSGKTRQIEIMIELCITRKNHRNIIIKISVDTNNGIVLI